jgi:hypothetical protein
VIGIIPERVIGMPGTLIGILRNPHESQLQNKSFASFYS